MQILRSCSNRATWLRRARNFKGACVFFNRSKDTQKGSDFISGDAVKPFGNSQKGIRMDRLTWV
jgi:hypothetical protein